VLLDAVEETQPIACQAAAAGGIVGCASRAGWDVFKRAGRRERVVRGLEGACQLCQDLQAEHVDMRVN
jgi:hypothetical protein